MGALVTGVQTSALPIFGQRPKYRFASAGSSYPLQTWVLVRPDRVQGLAGGLYYHHPDRHDLELVAPGAALPASAHAEVNRMACETAAFTIFLVAAYSAIRPLYGELARDFCLIEAGGNRQLLMDVPPEHGLGLGPPGRDRRTVE